MENTPKVWVEHFKEPISEIKLVLLERMGENSVNPYYWTPYSKGRIASEYPRSVANYFEEIGVDESCYSIIQVSGSTESYLEIDSFDYCDAIVESGRTIEDNNLRIVKILAPQIQAAMYTLVEWLDHLFKNINSTILADLSIEATFYFSMRLTNLKNFFRGFIYPRGKKIWLSNKRRKLSKENFYFDFFLVIILFLLPKSNLKRFWMYSAANEAYYSTVALK